MRVMFIVYHDLKTEARSQDILKCATMLGETVLVSYSEPIKLDSCKLIITGKGEKKYLSFIVGAIKAIRKIKPDIIILHDNYTTPLLWYIKKYHKNTQIIYDSSELYIERVFPKSLKNVYSEILRYLEKKYISFADIVISANIERANIMKKYFALREMPIIFDNIHRIDDPYDLSICNEKYGSIFQKDKFIIVYGGGLFKSRPTYELVRAIKELGKRFQLVIVGYAIKAEIDELLQICKIENIDNVKYLGLVTRNEWRYMLSKSNVSASIFYEDTINNKYCASGKLYESLFELTPVLLSNNPPFKRLCDDYCVGVSTDDYSQGIKELEQKYDFFSTKVVEYISTINYDNRVHELANELKERIKLRIENL